MYVPGVGHVRPFDDETVTIPADGTVVTLDPTKTALAQWIEARLEGPNIRYRYNADPAPTGPGTQLLAYDLWKDDGADARRLRMVIVDDSPGASDSKLRAIYFR